MHYELCATLYERREYEYFGEKPSQYLRGSHINLEITGFDMDAFEKAMHRELSSQLNKIAYIAYEDRALMSDAQKIEAIKMCLTQIPGI